MGYSSTKTNLNYLDSFEDETKKEWAKVFDRFFKEKESGLLLLSFFYQGYSLWTGAINTLSAKKLLQNVYKKSTVAEDVFSQL